MSSFDHFNLIGPIYDLIFGRKVGDPIVARAEVEPTHNILDVGGGTGRITVLFEPITRQAIVVDSARRMLTQAQDKGLDCVLTLSEHLPFEKSTFDRIILVDALHHVIDQQ